MADSIALGSRPATLARFNPLSHACAFTVGLWLIVSLVLVFAFWHGVTTSLGGPDDALRLVEVRRFLAGQSYFDLFEPRLGLNGYLTHWSRLIDLGLAGSITFFSMFAGQLEAEIITRALWPLPFLALVMIAQTAVASRIGGQRAAMLAALLGATCLPGFAHFAPGSIDHHHVQIALCVLATALMIHGLGNPRATAAAGVAVALLLGIGLEAIAFVGAGASVMALAFVIDGRRGPQLRVFGLALAASAVAVYAASVAPARWSVVTCDALAINSLALIVVGGLSIAVATGTARHGRWSRLAAAIGAGVVAVATYLAFDPLCATGPFAHVDPALQSLWLNHVTELRSIVALARDAPGMAMFYAAFPLLGLIAAAALLRDALTPERALIVAVFAIGCIVAAFTVRAASYPNWFAVPLVATALAHWLDRRPGWSALRRAAAIFSALPLTASTLALLALTADGDRANASSIRRNAASACFASSAYQDLARLPPGLVLSHLDIASHVLALTPHRIVMGPYHRIDRDVLLALRLFAGPTEAAAAPLRRVHVDYIVDCAPLELTSAGDGPSFRSALIAGNVPDFLEPVDAGEGSPLLIWRVKNGWR